MSTYICSAHTPSRVFLGEIHAETANQIKGDKTSQTPCSVQLSVRQTLQSIDDNMKSGRSRAIRLISKVRLRGRDLLT